MAENEKWGSGPLSSQTLVIVNAPCHSSVQVGQPVYLDPVTKVMRPARANANSTSNAIGVVSVKGSRTTCDVVFSGWITLEPDEDFVPGTDYFLSATAAGEFTTTPPTGSGHTVLKMATALTKTVLLVKIATRLRRA